MAAARDQQDPGLRAPAIMGAGAERFGRGLERSEPGVGAPVGHSPGVVVTVVRGRPLVDGAIGADTNANALPIVSVVAGRARDRHAAQRRRVRVVSPVLQVEVAGPYSGAVRACGFRRFRRLRPAVDDVDESGDRQTSIGVAHRSLFSAVTADAAATAAEVDREGAGAALEEQ